MICIYDKKTLKEGFSNNGLCILNEVISADIIEELNGEYALELEYPIGSGKEEYLKEFNIIKANNQLFRIYKVEKIQNIDKRIKIYATHIFYDLANYFIEDVRIVNGSLKTALQKALVEDLIFTYSVDSDVTKSQTLYMVEMSPANAIFKIIDRWGEGELIRDNFSIKVMKNIGIDTGVLISYGKNINGVKVNIDGSLVATKIYPKGANGVRLTEKYISVPNWESGEYPPFPIIKMIEIKEAEDEVTLRTIAKEVAKSIGLSSINIQVDFIELTKTKEYEKLKGLEEVNVGDIVTVRHKEFNLDVKVKVIKTRKILLKGINSKVELGQPLGDLFKALDTKGLIKEVTDELGNRVDQAITSMLYHANFQSLDIGTTEMQVAYLGINAIDNTNLALNIALSLVSTVESVLEMQILLDNKEIDFKAKQKLLVGENTIGVPIGIPQIPSGAHYIGVKVKVSAGRAIVAPYNFQVMIDGRSLKGGINAEPPHAEIEEQVKFINRDISEVVKDNLNIIFSENTKGNIIERSNYEKVYKGKMEEKIVIELK